MIASTVTIVIAIAIVGLLPLSGRAVATASVEDGELRVVPVGLAKVWAARGKVGVPASTVESVDTRPDLPRLGWRIAGTGLGSFCSAGYFRGNGTKTFAVAGRERPLVEITLNGAKYDRIIFSAADPEGVAGALRTKLGSPTSDQGPRPRA